MESNVIHQLARRNKTTVDRETKTMDKQNRQQPAVETKKEEGNLNHREKM